MSSAESVSNSTMSGRVPPQFPVVSAPVRPTTGRDVKEAFLGGHHNGRTRGAYRNDLEGRRGWYTFCARHRIDPLTAHRFHIDRWVAELVAAELRPATIARMASAVRSLYAWAVEQEVITRSPVPARDRSLHLPRVPDQSPALGLDRGEARALLAAARERGARDAAAIGILLYAGLRASELCGLNRADVQPVRGHRTLLVRRKGGEEQRLTLSPAAAMLVDDHLSGRLDAEEPLLLAGTRAASWPRMTRQHVAWIVDATRRAAGIGVAITPHGLRHTCATQMLDEEVPLRDVQVFLGHRSPTTTQRYDRGRNNLDCSPAYRINGIFG